MADCGQVFLCERKSWYVAVLNIGLKLWLGYSDTAWLLTPKAVRITDVFGHGMAPYTKSCPNHRRFRTRDGALYQKLSES